MMLVSWYMIYRTLTTGPNANAGIACHFTILNAGATLLIVSLEALLPTIKKRTSCFIQFLIASLLRINMTRHHHHHCSCKYTYNKKKMWELNWWKSTQLYMCVCVVHKEMNSLMHVHFIRKAHCCYYYFYKTRHK